MHPRVGAYVSRSLLHHSHTYPPWANMSTALSIIRLPIPGTNMILHMQRRAARFSSREQPDALLLNAWHEVIYQHPQLNLPLDPELRSRYNMTGPGPSDQAHVDIRPYGNLGQESLTWSDVEKILTTLRPWYFQDAAYDEPRTVVFRIDDIVRDVPGVGEVRTEWVSWVKPQNH